MKQADAEIIEIIAQVFLDTAPRDLQRLRDALNTGQIDEALRMAHTLKGSLASFNANPAVQLATEIELGCQAGNMFEFLKFVDAIEAEISKLRPWIAQASNTVHS